MSKGKPPPTQYCPALTKEMRAVLDDAARRYGVDWHVRTSRHNKIYLGGRMITVVSMGRQALRNNRAPVRHEDRLRQQIERAMKEKRP